MYIHQNFSKDESMRLLTLVMFVLSFSALAAETKVMSVATKVTGHGALSTKFVVDLNDQIHGVSLTVTKRVGSPKNRRTVVRTFFKAVPELVLNGDVLEMNIDGAVVECGIMGETRVFRLPVLRLNGNCDLIAKRNAQTASVEVSLVTK
jgi:hypothetical protein